MLSITSLSEDSQFLNSLRSIAYSLATYAESHDDLMQVALLHLLLSESEHAGSSRRNNRSWHLENCRLHLLDYLGRGRSIDSWKRHYARERLPDESDSMDSPEDAASEVQLGCDDSLLSRVSPHDIIALLSPRLTRRELLALRDFAEGFTVKEISLEQNLSRQLVRRIRRKLGVLARQFGILPPGGHHTRESHDIPLRLKPSLAPPL